jgi:hypothetical protein
MLIEFITVKKIEVRKPFRCLKNYKAMHLSVAVEKGMGDRLIACRTLTQARKLLFP